MRQLFLILIIMGGIITMVQADEIYLQKELEPLQQYIGTTWKGVMAGSDPGNPSIDIQHWERILNGTAIRIMHSINQGQYGGETIIFWDKESESLTYYYFTTGGFYTSGSITVENGNYIALEKVKGNEQGITEVKSSSQLQEDGSLLVSSEYFKNGDWVEGHKIVYRQAPEEKVIFK